MQVIGVLAAESRPSGGALGFVVPLIVLVVLGLVVVRSLRRQRAYERQLLRNPDGQPPVAEPDRSDDTDPSA